MADETTMKYAELEDPGIREFLLASLPWCVL